MNNFLAPQRFTWRVLVILIGHAIAFVMAYWLSYALRYDFQIPSKAWPTFWLTLPALLAIKLVVFYALGHCHGWWRYVTFSDLSILLRAATLSLLILAALDYFAADNYHIAKSILLFDWAMTIVLLGGMRCLWRLSREEFWPLLNRKGARRAFIVGANQAGESLARQLALDPRLNYAVVGFLDHDSSRLGMRLGGVPVVGRPEAAPALAGSFGVEDVLVVSGSLTGKQMRVLMERCQAAELNFKVLPGMDELLNSNFRLQLRDVEINDLLRREPVKLSDPEIAQLLEGRTVLVTGAGGSIGSEICRQVLRFHPKELILVEQAENSLFVIEQELLAQTAPHKLRPVIADICDPARMQQVFETCQPEVVFHAAAHKHVPMMERNPSEAIRNNILGTKQLVDLAHQFEVKYFVMISTDKAVNPTSVMGYSKQMAERYVHAFSETSSTRFVVVRFGNVLGSNGSVVPIFREQIRRGGPITVTHPDIERYFMTIPEASQLVLQAAAMGKGGEIFVLDMGEPVRIVDLAKDLMRLSGLTPDDVEIHFTGLRPGEKLYEELYFDNEETMPTPHPKVFVAYHRPFRLGEVTAAIGQLTEMLDAPEGELRRVMKEIMPEYQVSEPTRQSELGGVQA